MTAATATAPRRRPSLRSVEDRNAKTETNINLARGYLARRFRRNPALASDDDLFQAACMGIMRAAEVYDPTRLNSDGWPIAFSTVAEWWMQKEVNDELRNMGVIRVPRCRSEAYAEDAARASAVVSLTPDDDRGQRYDPPAREASEEEMRAREQRWAAVEAKLSWALERMSLTDQRFLRARIKERLALREIAESEGISTTRIRERLEAARSHLDRVLHEKGLF